MISISMVTADSNGTVVLKDGESELGLLDARVTRESTLDGGAVITHSGVSHSDRTFVIKTRITQAQKDALVYIHENSTSVIVACSEGAFIGSISSLNASSPKIIMKILIKSKEN